MLDKVRNRLTHHGLAYKYEELTTRNRDICHIFQFQKDVGLAILVEVLEGVKYNDMRYNKMEYRFAYVSK